MKITIDVVDRQVVGVLNTLITTPGVSAISIHIDEVEQSWNDIAARDVRKRAEADPLNRSWTVAWDSTEPGPISVACPLCKAKPDVRCKSASGNYGDYFHRSRVRAYDQGRRDR